MISFSLAVTISAWIQTSQGAEQSRQSRAVTGLLLMLDPDQRALKGAGRRRGGDGTGTRRDFSLPLPLSVFAFLSRRCQCWLLSARPVHRFGFAW